MKFFLFLFVVQFFLESNGETLKEKIEINCEQVDVPQHSSSFSICFARRSDRTNSIELRDAATHCSRNFPPDGALVDVQSLPSNSIDLILKNLQKILEKNPNSTEDFRWITNDESKSSSIVQFFCPSSCSKTNSTQKNFVLKTFCETNKRKQPCFTTNDRQFDRSIFLCASTKLNRRETEILPEKTTENSENSHLETKIFYDRSSCLNARTPTHQYSFCFRRQNCSTSQTSAFCTTKLLAEKVCQNEKNQSHLLTIESEDEYRLINDVIYKYSDETLLNAEGKQTSKHIVRAQWMWIDGVRVSKEIFEWKNVENATNRVVDRWWCDEIGNCSGSRIRDHIVLNIVCRINSNDQQICFSSRRASEPGPFICKRKLTDNEEPIPNSTFLYGRMDAIKVEKNPVYEKNSTSIYYDDNHCLTVQSRTHLYSFCFRRQNCSGTQAFCTRWSQANSFCHSIGDQSQLLTIENGEERQLVTDVVNQYSFESRLTFNGSSYRYFFPADFLWIDGVQQTENRSIYRWKNGKEIIGDELWCPKPFCDSFQREHVTLNVLCNSSRASICLGTRHSWKLAPFVCKRPRPIDLCPLLFDRIRNIAENEMLVVTLNRSIALIKCKHPELNHQIKVQYSCDSSTKRWTLIYENPDFNCPKYEIPEAFSGFSNDRTNQTASGESDLETIKTPETAAEQCSQTEFNELVESLSTKSEFLSFRNKSSPWASNYFDQQIFCRYNKSIQITFRCDVPTRKWIYVYGSRTNFQRCFPSCGIAEKNYVLTQYLSEEKSSAIRAVRRKTDVGILRFRCFNHQRRGWIGIRYKCASFQLNETQLNRLNSCFKQDSIEELPVVTVSMSIRDSLFRCPPPVVAGSPCEKQPGHFIYDHFGCPRKICPTMSELCHTTVCPTGQLCQIVPCQSCIETNFLRATCEFAPHGNTG